MNTFLHKVSNCYVTWNSPIISLVNFKTTIKLRNSERKDSRVIYLRLHGGVDEFNEILNVIGVIDYIAISCVSEKFD